MFQEEKKIINGTIIFIPENSFKQDEFIGLWRKAQEKAINMLRYDFDIIKNVDEEVDKLTIQYYLEMKGRKNVCK